MTAQYVRSAGPGERHFVNQDFVDAVGELYNQTWEKIPLGWHVYTGWQGKDEVLFTQHDTVGNMEGQTYEVNFQPDRPKAFFGDILPHIQYTKMAHEVSTMTRQRLTWDHEFTKKWGSTLRDTIELRQKEATRVPSGLYGYTKAIQASCEIASRKLTKQAVAVIQKTIQRDPRVIDFLGIHSKRASSLPAKILLASFKESLPKVASTEKEAKHYGMYGYPVKTAALGVHACSQIREAAGIIAMDLHKRQAALHAKITGFLGEHGKTAKSGTCKMLLSVYPEEGFKFGKRAADVTPQSVDDWLAWEPDAT